MYVSLAYIMMPNKPSESQTVGPIVLEVKFRSLLI